MCNYSMNKKCKCCNKVIPDDSPRKVCIDCFRAYKRNKMRQYRNSNIENETSKYDWVFRNLQKYENCYVSKATYKAIKNQLSNINYIIKPTATLSIYEKEGYIIEKI